MERWKRSFEMKLPIESVGFVLAAAYALSCWAARQVSMDQFHLPAGLRVAALLMFPMRLWPYLILGEYAYFAHMRFPMIDTYGLAWTILSSVSLMPAVALIVHWHRRLMDARTDAWFISAAMTSALVVTLLNLGFSHLLWPVPHRNDFLTDATRGALGQFIGILTLAPLALLWTRRKSGWEWNRRYAAATAGAAAVIVGLGLLTLLVPTSAPSLKITLQLLVALPAIALTCMHGWRGAAIAVPLVNMVIGLTSRGSEPWSFDSSTFVAQQILMIAGVALLTLGYSISHYYHHYTSGRKRELVTAAHARASHFAGEMDLRRRVLEMRKMGDGIDHSLSEIAYYLRDNGHPDMAHSLLQVSVANSRKFREHTSLVYPTALEHVGLYLSVQLSGLGEHWRSSRRVLSPRMVGDPCGMSTGLQLAAYRAMAEAVSVLLEHEEDQIRVHARCGQIGGTRGIFVVVALIDPQRHITEGTMGITTERLTGRTLPYGGTVQCRRNRVRILLVESSEAEEPPLS
ncbi:MULTISPECIES: MASE1 domain-containing protein [Stenotrophomonas]|uniref:MASE1 domain-containing protein n=1 Tax=Stenotrophomonas TaxID=40323 RepID=UPI000871D5E7|nr:MULTISPECIES: MASE1 domain-containing protein [Stenotrophomonas]OEY99955.1 hypothetical protein BIY45_14115 [Stenotrophomonas sp. BIIR7]